MALSQETRAVIDRLNTATNKIAARLTKLAEQIATGGMSAADEAAAVTELNALAANLEGMGTDPDAPIPPEPPVTPAP